jgi:hypothetical protein
MVAAGALAESINSANAPLNGGRANWRHSHPMIIGTTTADSLPYSRGALGDATLSLSVLLRATGETSGIVGSWR